MFAIAVGSVICPANAMTLLFISVRATDFSEVVPSALGQRVDERCEVP